MDSVVRIVDFVLIRKSEKLFYSTFTDNEPFQVKVNKSGPCQWNRLPAIDDAALQYVGSRINSKAFTDRVFFHDGLHVIHWRPQPDTSLLMFVSANHRQEQPRAFFQKHPDLTSPEVCGILFHDAEHDDYISGDLRPPLLPVENQFPASQVLRYLTQKLQDMNVMTQNDIAAWDRVIAIFEMKEENLSFDKGGLPLEWMGIWYWLKWVLERYCIRDNGYVARMSERELDKVRCLFKILLENTKLQNMAPKGTWDWVNGEVGPWELDSSSDEEDRE